MTLGTERRLQSASARVLKMLADGLWHQNVELDLVAGRALHSRITDLRDIGYHIETRRDSSSIFSYRLINVYRARRFLG